MSDGATAEGPRVSVVVPCRNEVRHIEACLRSVLAFEPPPGGFEVIVADGMSDDGTREVLARLSQEDPRVRMVDNPERTTPCALNAAIRAARALFILRVDAHTEYAADYLLRCVEVQQETGADNVGGPWVAQGRGYCQRAIAAAFASPFAVGGARGHAVQHEGPVDTVYLGFWPRQVFDRIGMFDEELVRNQDDELNLRLLKAGGRIWQSPRIRSWYTPRGSLPALYRQYFQYGYWKVRVIQKHHRPASVRHVVPGAFAAALALLALAAPLLPLAGAGFWLLVGLYLLALGGASVLTAARAGWDLLPVLPLVFLCYHWGYGLGFAVGLWDFVLRQRATGRFVGLTRR